MSTPLRAETDGPVQVWTIDVPEVGNAITGPDVSYRIGLVTARRELRPPIVAAFWEETQEIDSI